MPQEHLPAGLLNTKKFLLFVETCFNCFIIHTTNSIKKKLRKTVQNWVKFVNLVLLYTAKVFDPIYFKNILK